MNEWESDYWDIIQMCREEGFHRKDRTGVGCDSLFSQCMRHDLSQGFPLLKAREINWSNAFIEMNWMLRGETNIRPLCLQGCNIWVDWPLERYRKAIGDDTIKRSHFISRIRNDAAFADQWGDLGPVYGAQWRNWGGLGLDQLYAAKHEIITNPNSRRVILSAWNVGDLSRMLLPPCHHTYQFFVRGDYLDCQLTQRSADMYLGVPYNFANLAYLTHAMAHATEKQPGVIHWTGVDCHVYANHHDEVDTAISQYDPNDERHPRLRLDTGFSVLYPDMEHVMLEDYFPGPPVPAPVAV